MKEENGMEPEMPDEGDMCGDGSDMGHARAANGEEKQQENGTRKREGPLKIKGTLNDVLRAAMREKPGKEKQGTD